MHSVVDRTMQIHASTLAKRATNHVLPSSHNMAVHANGRLKAPFTTP